MIKSIRLRNFQSHRDNTFNFTTGVNSVVGVTDAGKTACIRALKWITTNRPLGNSFISNWAKESRVDKNGVIDDKKAKQILPCIVTIETTEHLVERYKMGLKNTYTVDGVELEAVGTSVPQEVLDALNFENINIQYQLDAPFLLTETSGEVARMLNKIVKLDDIDSTTRAIISYKQKLERGEKSLAYEIEVLEKELSVIDITEITNTVELYELMSEKLEGIKKDIEVLGDAVNNIHFIESRLEKEELIDLMSAKLKELDTLFAVKDKNNVDMSALLDGIEDIEELGEAIAQTSWVLDIEIEDIDSVFAESKEINKDITMLRDLLVDVDILQLHPVYNIDVEVLDMLFTEKSDVVAQILLLENLLADVSKLRAEPVFDVDVTILDTLFEESKAIKADISVLDKIVEDVVSSTKSRKEKESEIVDLIASLGDTCPTCGQRIEGEIV